MGRFRVRVWIRVRVRVRVRVRPDSVPQVYLLQKQHQQANTEFSRAAGLCKALRSCPTP